MNSYYSYDKQIFSTNDVDVDDNLLKIYLLDLKTLVKYL